MAVYAPHKEIVRSSTYPAASYAPGASHASGPRESCLAVVPVRMRCYKEDRQPSRSPAVQAKRTVHPTPGACPTKSHAKDGPDPEPPRPSQPQKATITSQTTTKPAETVSHVQSRTKRRETSRRHQRTQKAPQPRHDHTCHQTHRVKGCADTRKTDTQVGRQPERQSGLYSVSQGQAQQRALPKTGLTRSHHDQASQRKQKACVPEYGAHIRVSHTGLTYGSHIRPNMSP